MDKSMLPELVRLKLVFKETNNEVITSISALRTEAEQERLGIDNREAEKLIRNVQTGRLLSQDVSGFIIWEKDYRVLRNLGIVDLLW